MSALLAPFLPYVFAAVAALLGAGGYIWKTKRDARKDGISEQKAKEAAAREQNLDRIKSVAGVKPSGSVHDDPNNRDNARR